MKNFFGMHLVSTAVLLVIAAVQPALGCSRLLYETGTSTYLTARSMDWSDTSAPTSLWVYPRGLDRHPESADAFGWTSRYGSIIATLYHGMTVDGINEKGLVGNVLYLAESEFPDPSAIDRPSLSIGGWLQYFLDRHATVDEAVAAMLDPKTGAIDPPFVIVAPTLPNDKPASGHLSLSDPSGDSAILEYLDGELVIHHGPEHRVMTNSPAYDQQLALHHYWREIGGETFLPGTISSPDRFARLSYNLAASPKYDDPDLAVASVFSQIRSISVPLGMDDPQKPNIASTLWRTVADSHARRFYFESVVFPSVFWVDLDRFDLAEGAQTRTLTVEPSTPRAGETSGDFVPGEPFEWLE